MTIKQLGGVFGRNPTFNNVDVDGEVVVDGKIVVDSIGVGTSNVTNKITVLSTSGSGIYVYGADQAYTRIAIDNLNGQEWNLIAGTAGASNSGFGIYDVDAGATRMQFDATGNVTVNSGNLVIGTSGQGIDFSATSDGPGTIVSELLDDYEEGYYTATTTTGSGSVTTDYDRLNYTKVGRSCTVSGEIRVSSVSTPGSALTVSLPFAAASGSERSQRTHFYVLLLNLTGSPTGSASGVITNSGATTFEIVIYDDFGSVPNTASFLQVGSTIRVGFTYQTA